MPLVQTGGVPGSGDLTLASRVGVTAGAVRRAAVSLERAEVSNSREFLRNKRETRRGEESEKEKERKRKKANIIFREGRERAGGDGRI